MKKALLIAFGFVLLLQINGNANTLSICWEKQVASMQDEYLHFAYVETYNKFTHSANPWEERSYSGKGAIWLNRDNFFKSDTLTNQRNRNYFSKKEFTRDNLLFLDYGDDDLYKVTQSMLHNQLIESIRYSPVLILNYFYEQKIEQTKAKDNEVAIYEAKINEVIVRLYIDKRLFVVKKIATVSAKEEDDEAYGFGDVLDQYYFEEYVDIGGCFFPKEIKIEKLNGKLNDQVRLTHSELSTERKKLLTAPSGYQIAEDEVVTSDITIEKYSENIYFINLHHCGTRSLMVEFADFVLVAESPLNSENGALLLNEVEQIAPGKRIEFFTFGHFHPHYTGGIRPFIHKGAKVICTKEDKDYINYIATVPHTIVKDSLQMFPKKVMFELIQKEKTISDGEFEMKIYHIGAKSNHTNDYLIYYFPKEKMIFQDDLVWIRDNTTKENLSKTTKGFYSAVKDLHLEVNEVVQNWHVFDKSKKMIFKFSDIERIMEGN